MLWHIILKKEKVQRCSFQWKLAGKLKSANRKKTQSVVARGCCFMTMHVSERSPRERRFKGIGAFVGSQLNQQKRKKNDPGNTKASWQMG